MKNASFVMLKRYNRPCLQ